MEPIRAQVHAPSTEADRITTLVTLAGLHPTDRAELALLVGQHDESALTDRWLVDSRPHLVVRLGAGAVRVGPFVQPGVTACVRCMEIGASSPARARPAPTTSGPSGGDALDPALVMSALGLAVRDLATWHQGGVPITWSASLVLSAVQPPELERWPRHPHCGCSWGPLDHRTTEQRRHRAR